MYGTNLTNLIVDLINNNIFGEIPDDKSVVSSEGQSDPPVETGEDVDTETPIETEKPAESFPREVVTKLRQENQTWRKKLRETEGSLAKFQKELDDLKKTQDEAKKKEELSKLETTERLNKEIVGLNTTIEGLKKQVEEHEIERSFTQKTKYVEDAAKALGFIDPSDAVNLMDVKTLADMGTDALDMEGIKEELQDILMRKPYLAVKATKVPPAELPTNPPSDIKSNAKKPGEPPIPDTAKIKADISNLVKKGQGGEAYKLWIKNMYNTANMGTPHAPRKVS